MGTKISCDYYWNGHHLLGSRKSSRSYRFSLNSEPNVKRSLEAVVKAAIRNSSRILHYGVILFGL